MRAPRAARCMGALWGGSHFSVGYAEQCSLTLALTLTHPLLPLLCPPILEPSSLSHGKAGISHPSHAPLMHPSHKHSHTPHAHTLTPLSALAFSHLDSQTQTAFTLTLTFSNSGTKHPHGALTHSDNNRGTRSKPEEKNYFRPLGAPFKIGLSELLNDFSSFASP